MNKYQLRIETKSGRKTIEKVELVNALKILNSQSKVADYFEVSQMTISRAKNFLKIDHDGKSSANKSKEKRDAQSKTIKRRFKSGEIKPYWLGKKQTKESNKKNRQAHLGNKASKETRDKMSKSQKDYWERRKELAGPDGIKCSEKTRERISKAQKKRYEKLRKEKKLCA